MGKEQPPWRPGRAAHVLRVEGTAPQLIVFLGSMLGHREHYDKRGNLPCIGPKRACKHCGRLPDRFYAYASVLWQDDRTGKADPWVIQLTACMEETLRPIPDLRGQVWCLQRVSELKTAELIGHFLEQRAPDTLPAAFGVIPVLQRVFQTTDLVIPNKNPFPDRVIPSVHEITPLALAAPPEILPLKSMPIEDQQKLRAKHEGMARKAGLK